MTNGLFATSPHPERAPDHVGLDSYAPVNVTFENHFDAIYRDQGVTPEERALIEDAVVHVERPADGVGANDVRRLELGSSREGAYFKPINGVNATLAYLLGHSRESVVLAEIAAYRLAYALAGPYVELVPPCVLRFVPEVDEDAPGSLMSERFDDRAGNVFQDAPALALQAAFFDALIGNQDRSGFNMLFDPSREDLALIDHGFAFRREHDPVNASVFVDWRRRAGLPALAPEERDALERLLEDGDLLGMRRYLEVDRADALHDRARAMYDSGSLV
jgi:hypothetical protein